MGGQSSQDREARQKRQQYQRKKAFQALRQKQMEERKRHMQNVLNFIFTQLTENAKREEEMQLEQKKKELSEVSERNYREAKKIEEMRKKEEQAKKQAEETNKMCSSTLKTLETIKSISDNDNIVSQSVLDYKEKNNELFQMLIQTANGNFTDSIKKQPGETHHLLLGGGGGQQGKTSMVNYYCNTQFQTDDQSGGKTVPVKLGKINNKVVLWQATGLSDIFDYCEDILSFFISADKIFILYDTSLAKCKQLIQLIHKLNPDALYFIRTKCDAFNKKQRKTLDEEMEVDRDYLTKLKINTQNRVLAFSSFRGQNFKDNRKIRELLLN